MDPSIDHLERLRTIHGKLRRVRFGGVLPSRRPQHGEAALDFQSLSRQFRQENCLEYAGICLLQSARCFGELKSSTCELQMLIEAAHVFLEVELEFSRTHTLSYQENLSIALAAYQMAQKNLRDQNEIYLAGLLSFQMGIHLEILEKFDESERLFQMSIDSFKDLTSIQILIYQRLLNLRIDQEKFNLALKTSSTLIHILLKSSNNDISARRVLVSCDIARLFLLLILQPHPQRLEQEYSKTLDAFSWETFEKLNSPTCYIDETLFYLLQSISLAVQARDLNQIETFESDLYQHAQINQRHLHLFQILKRKLNGHFIDEFSFDEKLSNSSEHSESH